MNPKWAEENLQTIRTLMERSAIYRRALAPIMIYVGIVGILAGIIATPLRIGNGQEFLLCWFGVAVVAILGAFLLVRRQALKDAEPFLSPPTKRVIQALAPSFTIGALIGGLTTQFASDHGYSMLLIPAWSWAYGSAVCAASFFLPRSAKYFGWIYIIIGFALVYPLFARSGFSYLLISTPHLCMATVFGGPHLAYGIYLYFTEKKNPVA